MHVLTLHCRINFALTVTGSLVTRLDPKARANVSVRFEPQAYQFRVDAQSHCTALQCWTYVLLSQIRPIFCCKLPEILHNGAKSITNRVMYYNLWHISKSLATKPMAFFVFFIIFKKSTFNLWSTLSHLTI